MVNLTFYILGKRDVIVEELDDMPTAKSRARYMLSSAYCEVETPNGFEFIPASRFESIMLEESDA